MRTLRQFFTASVLTLVLTLGAFAGEMTTGLEPPPPPPSASAQGEMTTGAPGNIHTGEPSADVTLAGAVVDLVEGVLALL